MSEHSTEKAQPQPGDYVPIPDWYCTDSARGDGWGSRGDECEFCERYMFAGTESVTEDAWAEHYYDDHGFRVRMTEAEIAAALRILAPGDDDNVTLGEIRRDLTIPPEGSTR